MGFKFVESEARKKFERIDCEIQREKYRYASQSTEEYQKLEGELDHVLTGEGLKSDLGGIKEWLGSKYKELEDWKREEFRNH